MSKQSLNCAPITCLPFPGSRDSIPDDPYCYPGTDVLINHGDFRIQSGLNKFEADAVFLAFAALQVHPIAGPFDARRLKETHRRIFGNVYPWAGEFRQGIGMMTKERSGFVVTYGPSENLPAALGITFAALKAENDLRGLDAARFAGRLAFHYSELDAIHPVAKGTRAPCVPSHPTLHRRQATSSTGPGWAPHRKTASEFTTPAIWP